MGADLSRPSYRSSRHIQNLYLPSETLIICDGHGHGRHCHCPRPHHGRRRHVYVDRSGYDGSVRYRDPMQYIERLIVNNRGVMNSASVDGVGGGGCGGWVEGLGWSDVRDWRTQDFERLVEILEEFLVMQRGRYGQDNGHGYGCAGIGGGAGGGVGVNQINQNIVCAAPPLPQQQQQQQRYQQGQYQVQLQQQDGGGGGRGGDMAELLHMLGLDLDVIHRLNGVEGLLLGSEAEMRQRMFRQRIYDRLGGGGARGRGWDREGQIEELRRRLERLAAGQGGGGGEYLGGRVINEGGGNGGRRYHIGDNFF